MPVHHLHDGSPAPFYVSKFNTKPISNKPAASIGALQWAADRAGLSYGQFIIGLSTADQLAIQAEYEGFLAARKEAMAARPRVDTDKPSTSDRTGQSREAPSTPDKECKPCSPNA